jgi:hypothetical protein
MVIGAAAAFIALYFFLVNVAAGFFQVLNVQSRILGAAVLIGLLVLTLAYLGGRWMWAQVKEMDRLREELGELRARLDRIDNYIRRESSGEVLRLATIWKEVQIVNRHKIELIQPLDEQALCINVGRNHGVNTGMRFAIHDLNGEVIGKCTIAWCDENKAQLEFLGEGDFAPRNWDNVGNLQAIMPEGRESLDQAVKLVGGLLIIAEERQTDSPDTEFLA